MTNDMHTLRGPIGRIASVPPTKMTTIADRDVGYDLGPQIWFWDVTRSFELERLPELKREIYQFCYTYRSVCLDPLYHALCHPAQTPAHSLSLYYLKRCPFPSQTTSRTPTSRCRSGPGSLSCRPTRRYR